MKASPASKLLWFGILCAMLSATIGFTKLAMGQEQNQTLSCPSGSHLIFGTCMACPNHYYMASDYKCYYYQPSSGLRNSSATDTNRNDTSVTQEASVSQGAIGVPVEANQFSQGLEFSNAVFYINASDGHYHLKVLVKNMLPETISDTIGMTIDFKDKSTGATIKSFYTTIDRTIDPGQAIPFDVDSGYTSAQSNQLQFMEVYITYNT